MTYNILSLDGGGVRGIFTARILARLDELVPGFLNNADLIAGSSTGAIIAILLAFGKTPSDIVALYRSNSHTIFNNNFMHDIHELWGITGARYTTTDRMSGILPAIGEVRLGDLPRSVFIPTFKLDCVEPASQGSNDTTPIECVRHWKAEFFHNMPGADSFLNERAIDVIMRASAAPTYFPIYQGYIDGGVVANNPSMCALAQAVNRDLGQLSVSDIVLLSVGSGSKPQFIASQDGNWGLQQWGFKIIDLLLESDIDLSDYQCRQLLGSRYYRIDVTLPEEISMDAVSRLDELVALADHLPLANCCHWLAQNWFGGANQQAF